MQVNMYYDQYETGLVSARSKFSDRVQAFSNEKDPRRLLMFWLNFSSFGVANTEFVEDWIRRAGQRTCELGYEALGDKLIKHAVHEKNHHLMMVKDTHGLVSLWNQDYAPPYLSAEKLLARKPLASSLAYQKLHEDCIQSEFPFAQIAIEYEIERLAVSHGHIWTKNVLSALGEGIASNLTFIFDHVEIDQAHTVYNRSALNEFVGQYPETVEKLIETGSLALNIFGTFLNDCYEHVESFEESLQVA